MKFFIICIYFYTVTDICWAHEPAEVLNLENGNFLSVYLDNYAKYVVYIVCEVDTTYEFIVGTIIANNIILTVWIQSGRSRHLGYVGAGIRDFQRRTPYKFSEVDTMNNAASAHNYTATWLSSQVTLIKLNNQLRLGENIAIVGLPEQHYKKDDDCITFGWGKLAAHNLQVHHIKILDTCFSDEVFCVIQYRRGKIVNICEEYAGGEPIFCKGVFVGMINHYYHVKKCNESEPRTATKVYDNLEWIKQHVKLLTKTDLSSSYEKLSSSSNRRECKKFLSFYLIYIFLSRTFHYK